MQKQYITAQIASEHDRLRNTAARSSETDSEHDEAETQLEANEQASQALLRG